MKFKSLSPRNKIEISELFTKVFTDSEGIDEGALVGGLAKSLADGIDEDNVICYGALNNGILLGASFYTRLSFKTSSNVFMLAPLAVHTDYQRKGVGQQLINFGLNELKRDGVDYVVTYGDPNYYQKVGFRAISEDFLQAPATLSMPEGWLGQSLTGKPLSFGTERPHCVEQFNNPAYW